jgi:PAT family beta-lactamase induction signal transducer AmpG
LIHSWKISLLAFCDRRILSIFLFGFSSGLPFLLTLSTLTLWLKESGLNHKTIGLFVITTIPYTFKFLWGPMVDRTRLPFLFDILGQRRSWALVSQLALIFMLLGLGNSDPKEYIFQTALWAFGVAFFSAIQDIAVESYRIEIIDEDQKGSAASSTYLGYRIGMMASGVGALYLASIFSWHTAYMVMATLISIGVLTTFFSPSPPDFTMNSKPRFTKGSFYNQFREWIKATYILPLKDLLRTLDWRIVLAFIFFYKVGDTTLSVMNTPFLVDLGFSKLEIANVAKFFGISAMIIGGIIGGIFLNHFGILSSLTLCAILQILTSLMFVVQTFVGYNLNILIFTIGFENLSCGLGAASFIAYLSSLCRTPHTATHFALLSSFGSLARIILSVFSGFLADLLPWSLFFTFTAIASLPCLCLLIYASQHFPSSPSFLRTVA